MLLSKSKFYIVGLTSEENRSMQGSVKGGKLAVGEFYKIAVGQDSKSYIK